LAARSTLVLKVRLEIGFQEGLQFRQAWNKIPTIDEVSVISQ